MKKLGLLEDGSGVPWVAGIIGVRVSELQRHEI